MFIDPVPFASLTPTTLTWLWNNRIATQRLSLLAADPGIGKTALAIDLAARLSRGLPLPPTRSRQHAPGNPRHTLLLSPEDHLTDILLPRLHAAGADLNFVHALTLAGTPKPADEPPPLHEALARALQNLPPISLIIIDPIHAYLPLTASTSQLRALTDLAEKYNLAILFTSRLAKRIPVSGLDFLSLRRALGSLAYASACRTVHLLLPEPTDPLRRHFITLKSNLASLPPTLAFSFAPPASTQAPSDSAALTPLLWDPEPVPADDALVSSPRDPILQDAIQFLKTALAQGPVNAVKMTQDATRNVITAGTLQRAKAALRVESRMSPAPHGKWYWALPGDHRPLAPANPYDNLSVEMLRTLVQR